MPITRNCLRCGVEFTRQKNSNECLYCSQMCANQRDPSFDVLRLQDLASRGLTLGQISMQLGIARSTVRHALQRYGFHRLWQLARYKKCREVA
jgi:hypothetical protein